jgi:WD40 repeat protein/predicted Ser/Thr protein kinase
MNDAGEQDEKRSADEESVPTASAGSAMVGLGEQMGRYKLLRVLGEGGFGIVYLAEQQRPIRRQVALKIIKPGMDSVQVIRRFEAERQALALLDHPHVAHVYDAGTTEAGRPYFAMEFVKGVPITEHCDRQKLTIEERLKLFIQVCEAIQHAHQKGIIHRDIKPSNIQVCIEGEQAVPKVIDFGVAKALSQPLTERTLVTEQGQLIGTPEYISPEQAEMTNQDIDTRADIYSLGVLLYELLTGTLPFESETLRRGSLDQMRQIIRETDPKTPSTRVSSLDAEASTRLAKCCQNDTATLRRRLRGDLDWITLKAMEKDRMRRYQTAHALAEDIERHLNNEPVLAGRPSTLYRFQKLVRRNKGVFAAAAVVAAVLVLGALVSTWQAVRATGAKREQSRLREEAVAVQKKEAGLRYASDMSLAQQAVAANDLGRAQRLLEDHRPAPGEPDFRGFEWRYLYRLCSGSLGEIIATNNGVFQSVAYSPDGHTVAFGTGDGSVEIFGADSHQRIKHWKAHEGAVDYLAYYPPNGNWLATTSGDDGILKLWDIERKQVILPVDSCKGISVEFAFSPTGRYLAARAADALSLNLWELHISMPGAAPAVTRKANLGFLGPAVFSPDERTLAVFNKKPVGTGALFDVPGERLAPLPEGAHVDAVRAAAFSRDGSKLVTGGGDERVVLWDVGDHVAISRQYETDLIMVTSVAFSPNAQTLFACGWGPNIRLWNLQKTPESLTLQGHGSGVNGMALAPDGRSLASAGRDGTARIWPLAKEGFEAAAQPVAPFRTLVRAEDTTSRSLGQGPVWALAVSPHEDKAVAASDEKLFVVDLRTDTPPVCRNVANVFGVQQTAFANVKFSSDGSQLVVGSADGKVAFLDATTLGLTKEPVQLHGSQIWGIDSCLDGKVLITSGSMGTGIKLTEIASRRLIREIKGTEGFYAPQPIAVSPDRALLATGSPEHLVRVWDIASGRLVTSSPEKVRFLHALAFSPDGRLLAYADELGAIFLWDFVGRRPLRKLGGHSGPVNALAFSPDGRTLASAGMDHTVRLWHPEIDQEVAILAGHTGWVWCVAFARHGDVLLSGSRDGTLKLWQAASWDEIKASERVTQLNP